MNGVGPQDVIDNKQRRLARPHLKLPVEPAGFFHRRHGDF